MDSTTYETNASVFLVDFRYRVAKKGELFLKSSYTLTDAAFGQVTLQFDGSMNQAVPGLQEELFPDGIPGHGTDNAPVSFADYDFTNVNQYSNIDLEELRTTLGFDYRFSKWASVFASIGYYDVKDNETYLQNATADVTLLRGGFNWTF